ncbi:unnamed protein product [Boreogadus saida]
MNDNYKDALRILKQYQNGCNTSDLQSEAVLEHEVELPDKRNRKPVHSFGDSECLSSKHYQFEAQANCPGRLHHLAECKAVDSLLLNLEKTV